MHRTEQMDHKEFAKTATTSCSAPPPDPRRAPAIQSASSFGGLVCDSSRHDAGERPDLHVALDEKVNEKFSTPSVGKGVDSGRLKRMRHSLGRV